MKLYLDVSCLNRPFDDQWQVRIRLESEAVTLIFEQCDAGRWQHVSSEMAEIEIAAITEPERRRRVTALLPDTEDRIRLTRRIFRRGIELEQHGFAAADALHLAAAEAAKADVFLTCDDRLLRRARRQRTHLKVPVANPLQWLEEQSNAPHA